MFGLPIWGIKAIGGALVAFAVCGTIYFAWRHFVAEPYREQGRAELRPKLAEDEALIKAARDRASQLALDYQTMQDRALKAEKERDALNVKNAAPLAAAVTGIKAGTSSLPSSFGRVFNAASDFARGSDAPKETSGSSPIPGPAETYDGHDIAEYIAQAARAYKSERDGRLSCETQYDDARAAQMK